MAEALSMGGYGFFVWTSYLVIGFLLVINYILPISKLRKMTRTLAKFYRTSER